MTTFYLYFVCLVKFLLMTMFYSFKKLKDLTNALLLKTCSFLSKYHVVMVITDWFPKGL